MSINANAILRFGPGGGYVDEYVSAGSRLVRADAMPADTGSGEDGSGGGGGNGGWFGAGRRGPGRRDGFASGAGAEAHAGAGVALSRIDAAPDGASISRDAARAGSMLIAERMLEHQIIALCAVSASVPDAPARNRGRPRAAVGARICHAGTRA